MEPVFDTTTERIYSRLPIAYQKEDAKLGWPLKKWLSGACSVMNDVEDLYDRFDYTPPEDGGSKSDTSDLVDPARTNTAWLPWLAQLVGVNLQPGDSIQLQRDKIAARKAGIKIGTINSIVEVVKTVLTGTKSVYVYNHSDDTGIGAGSEWDVLILTVQTETLSDPIAAVIEAGVKPAGVKLWHAYYGAPWDDIESMVPTWEDWEQRTWQKLEETGLVEGA